MNKKKKLELEKKNEAFARRQTEKKSHHNVKKNRFAFLEQSHIVSGARGSLAKCKIWIFSSFVMHCEGAAFLYSVYLFVVGYVLASRIMMLFFQSVWVCVPVCGCGCVCMIHSWTYGIWLVSACGETPILCVQIHRTKGFRCYFFSYLCHTSAENERKKNNENIFYIAIAYGYCRNS